ncbi:MAG: choice-of-anchor D domain-containing protein [Gammaproteobacteria bacterium]|nr:choice-of-anchor D domain-containing protein [Gammaproteobacteria bacterium]
MLSGDLNNNGIADDGDATSVISFQSRGLNTLIDGFHIEGALESAVKIDGRRPTLRNLVIRGNADRGLHITGGATPRLDNVLIHGNGGTGLVVEGSNPSFTGLTIAGNGKANTAVGGLSCTGPGESCGTYRNSIIWGNTGEDVKLSSDSGVLPNPTFHHSLLQGCKVGGIWNPACGTDGSNNLTDTDPQFVDAPLCTVVPNRLGDYRLQTGSPALDVGDNAATTQPKDLDGRDRVQGGTIDLGAYEGGVVVPPVDGACGTANGEATATAPTSCSLCETGTASAVAGSDGAWGWSCTGTGTGSTATCSAPYATPTITLKANPTSIKVGDEGSTVFASSTSGLKPELTSTTTDVCSVMPFAGSPSGTTVIATGVAAGTCTVKATLAGTGDVGTFRYLAANDESVDITVTKGAQTITSFAAAKSPLKVGEMTTLSATGGPSGNAVEFDTQDPENCFVSGNMVTALAAGSCVVLATQSGNDSYDAATTKTLRITINKAAQLISSFTANPASLKVGGMATLSASGGASGNSISFRSSTSEVCSVSGAMVTALSAGTCTVIASQAGNADFEAADEVSLQVTVNKAAQLISGFTANPSTIKVGQTSQLSAFGGASGNPITFGSTTDTCSVSGSTVTALAVGTCTVTASQAGNADFEAAETAMLNIGIEAADVATAPALKLDMNDLDFGTGYLLRFRDIGVETTSEPEVVTLSNTGTAPLSISSMVTTGDFRHTTTCGVSVAPGATCTISIRFSPKAVGTRTGETRIVSNAVSSPDLIRLSGTGKGLQPAIKTNVSSFNFGRVKVGAASRDQTLVISSSGSGPLEIRSVNVTGDYTGSHNCPRFLDAGKSCQVTGRFRPRATGVRPGAVSILTSVSSTPTQVTLTGTGTSGGTVN